MLPPRIADDDDELADPDLALDDPLDEEDEEDDEDEEEETDEDLADKDTQ